MAAPIRVTITSPAAHPDVSPVSMVLIGTKGSGATITPNTLTHITSATKLDTVIGTDGLLRTGVDRIQRITSPNLYVISYETNSDAAVLTRNIAAAINAAASDETRQALDGFSPDMIVLPNVGNTAVAGDSNIALAKNLAGTHRIAAIFVDAFADTQANAIAWAGNNTGDGIFAMSNNDGAGDDAVPGSIVAAAAHAHAIHAFNLNPRLYTVRDPVQASDPQPVRAFVPEANVGAELLADSYLNSIINYSGGHYLWGGAMSNDSYLNTVGRRLVTYTIVKNLLQLLIRAVHSEWSEAVAEYYQDQMETSVNAYLGRGDVAGYDIALPTIDTHGVVTAAVELQFNPRVESVHLTVNSRGRVVVA